MADERDDEERDFDTDMSGGAGSDKDDSADRKTGREDDDDDLEDLSREELYDKLKDANNTAKKYRLRLKRARSGDRTPARSSSRRDERDDDERDDSRNGRGQRDRGRDDDRGDRRDDRRRERDDDRDTRESDERAIRSEAKVALAAAGIPADRLSRAVRLIDTRNLEFDGDDLVGIEDEIDELKDEWPELFEKRRSRDDDDDDRSRRRIPRADLRSGNSNGRRREKTEKTASEKQAEMLAGWASK